MLEFILSLFITTSTSAPTGYSNVQKALEQIQSQNPTNSKLIDIGVSETGQMVQALKIGDGPTAALIVGTHHGNEYGSTAVALGAAESFAQNPLRDHTVYIIPVLNVAGYNSRSRYERSTKGSVDLNRDYPGPCRTGAPYKSKSSKLLADFIDSHKIVQSATLHTFAPAVLYPWGLSTRDTQTPYEDLFINLAKAATVESGYAVGNSTEYLYAADGTFEDYAFEHNGVWSLLFEMGRSHYPSESDLRTMVNVNVPGLRRFLEYAPKERATNSAFTGRCNKTVPQRYIRE